MAEASVNRTKPSKLPNPKHKPRGRRSKIPIKADDATRESIKLENEAADIIAKAGFDIEQNPLVQGTSKKPDYRIEGEIFDCYAPFEKKKSVRGIGTEVKEKIINKQTRRVVINLKNWEGDISKLQKQFSDWPIEGLEEIIYITKEVKIDYITLKK